MIDFTHDPAARCWVPGAQGHCDFPVQNLPLGMASIDGGASLGVTRIGDHVLSLPTIAGLMTGEAQEAARDAMGSLNDLAARGGDAMRDLRRQLFTLLTQEDHRERVEPHLHPVADAVMELPFRIGDYTDFYTGIHHAENIGRFFRPENPLLPNYKHVPIGYHGRASSVRVSGGDVIRPRGQTRPAEGEDMPGYGPSARLDYELEMGVWVGEGNALGQPVPIAGAGRHIAGISILNDWSARDLQAWEYQPLGPFLAKNFHSTVSPWVVTMDALAPFRTALPARAKGDPKPLPYLWDDADQGEGALAVTMEVLISTAAMRDAGHAPHRLSSGSMTAMYWTAAQMVAHHASNGCDLNPGDLLGTGTLSGKDETSWGSLMELSANGTKPIALPSGETRTFLEDGDEIVMRAFAEKEGCARIGFGECRGVIVGR